MRVAGQIGRIGRETPCVAIAPFQPIGANECLARDNEFVFLDPTAYRNYPGVWDTRKQ